MGIIYVHNLCRKFFFWKYFNIKINEKEQRKGRDVKHELRVTLNDLYTGALKKLAISRKKICDKCTGSGAKQGFTPPNCNTCNGSGVEGMF